MARLSAPWPAMMNFSASPPSCIPRINQPRNLHRAAWLGDQPPPVRLLPLLHLLRSPGGLSMAGSVPAPPPGQNFAQAPPPINQMPDAAQAGYPWAPSDMQSLATATAPMGALPPGVQGPPPPPQGLATGPQAPAMPPAGPPGPGPPAGAPQPHRSRQGG